MRQSLHAGHCNRCIAEHICCVLKRRDRWDDAVADLKLISLIMNPGAVSCMLMPGEVLA